MEKPLVFAQFPSTDNSYGRVHKIHAQHRADHACRWQGVSHRLLPAHREQVALPKRLRLIFLLYIMGGVNTKVTTHTEVP